MPLSLMWNQKENGSSSLQRGLPLGGNSPVVPEKKFSQFIVAASLKLWIDWKFLSQVALACAIRICHEWSYG